MVSAIPAMVFLALFIIVASYMTTSPLEESLKELVDSRALAKSAPVAW
jgi:hypothetical protein